MSRKIEEITTERGSNYGHPIDQFSTTGKMFKAWSERRSGGQEIPQELHFVLNHIAYMVIDKLVRLAENPNLQDGYDDIQGYASLWVRCQEEERKRRSYENIAD